MSEGNMSMDWELNFRFMEAMQRQGIGFSEALRVMRDALGMQTAEVEHEPLSVFAGLPYKHQMTGGDPSDPRGQTTPP